MKVARMADARAWGMGTWHSCSRCGANTGGFTNLSPVWAFFHRFKKCKARDVQV